VGVATSWTYSGADPLQLYNKILLGLVLGVFAGFVANYFDLDWLIAFLVAIQPIGTAWIRLITMIVVPLVVASLLVGTVSLGDLRKLGRIGGKTLIYYMTTTAIAVTIGLLVSNVIKPGSGIDEATRDSLAADFAGQAQASMTMAAEKPSTVEILLDMIPRNPVQAAAEMDLLALIVFTVIFGAALTLVDPPKKEAVVSFFDGVNQTCMVMIDWIMLLAPYAVFALIAAIVAQFGFDLLQSLLLYSFVVVLGLMLHATFTYGGALRIFAGLNPFKFFKRIRNAQIIAFSTSSSNATLPVTMETAEEQVGVSNEVASFVLPLGATINMDGTALYQAVAVMFIAQIYGIDLTIADQLIVVLTATLASVGAAGVPSAGIITLIIVLNSIGLGEFVQGGIALILGVDRILDMIRTAVNVTGDITASAVIARSEGEVLVPRPVDHPLTMAAG